MPEFRSFVLGVAVCAVGYAVLPLASTLGLTGQQPAKPKAARPFRLTKGSKDPAAFRKWNRRAKDWAQKAVMLIELIDTKSLSASDESGRQLVKSFTQHLSNRIASLKLLVKYIDLNYQYPYGLGVLVTTVYGIQDEGAELRQIGSFIDAGVINGLPSNELRTRLESHAFDGDGLVQEFTPALDALTRWYEDTAGYPTY